MPSEPGLMGELDAVAQAIVGATHADAVVDTTIAVRNVGGLSDNDSPMSNLLRWQGNNTHMSSDQLSKALASILAPSIDVATNEWRSSTDITNNGAESVAPTFKRLHL